MKTKNFLTGAMVVAITALLLGQANAQTQPVVKILPGGAKDVIKVLYCGAPNGSVNIEFLEADGTSILTDKIKNKKFDKGFLKKYKVNRVPGDFFWVEVCDDDTFVRYRVFGNHFDEWTAQLEKETHSYPVIASSKSKE